MPEVTSGEQLLGDFPPTEADWERLQQELERLLEVQKSFEGKYNFHGINSYTDFRTNLHATYSIVLGKYDKTRKSFDSAKRQAEAWKNYLSWLDNNQAFREGEFRDPTGYFPDIRDEIRGKFKNRPDEYNRQLFQRYAGSKFLSYIEQSAEKFAK